MSAVLDTFIEEYAKTVAQCDQVKAAAIERVEKASDEELIATVQTLEDLRTMKSPFASVFYCLGTVGLQEVVAAIRAKREQDQ